MMRPAESAHQAMRAHRFLFVMPLVCLYLVACAMPTRLQTTSPGPAASAEIINSDLKHQAEQQALAPAVAQGELEISPAGRAPPSHYQAWIAADSSESTRRAAFDAKIAAREAQYQLARSNEDLRFVERSLRADAERADLARFEPFPKEVHVPDRARTWDVALASIPFARSEVELASDTEPLLQLARFLIRHPQRGVRIVGHADGIGDPQSNLRLSERRAQSVRHYLLEQGVSDARIQIAARGSQAPIGDNLSAYGREVNRRVEVYVLEFD